MKTILGIEVPDDLTALSNDELSALASALREAAKTAGAGDVTPAVLAEIKEARLTSDTAKTELTARAEAEAALAAELATELAALADDDDEAEDDEEPEVEAVEEVIEEEPVKVAAAHTPVVRAASIEPTPAPEPAAPVHAVSDLVPAGLMLASSGVSGTAAGDPFASVSDLANALVDRWRDIAGGGSEKLTVAKVHGDFTGRRLTDDIEANLAMFGGRDPLAPSAQEAITAAMCAPAEPYYGLGCMSSTARPVRGSLPTYGAPRGRVSVYPTPRLADVDGGVGIWTRTDDANAEAVKEACATIPCASPVTYDIYGVYRCMTIKNLLAMTYPELVEAFLNRLAALQARLAEETLLDAMVASTNTFAVTATGTGLDASIDVLGTIINAITAYREAERYTTETLEFRAHRVLRDTIKLGLLRQRKTSGRFRDRIPTDAEVDGALRDVGVEPTWTLDYAASWDAMTAQADNADLVSYPTTADFVLSPMGNFRLLDRGDLNIGVTNNVVRDNTSNASNEFTMFFENFEGLIDFGCRNYAVTIEALCPNGVQTEDGTAIECAVSA